MKISIRVPITPSRDYATPSGMVSISPDDDNARVLHLAIYANGSEAAEFIINKHECQELAEAFAFVSKQIEDLR